MKGNREDELKAGLMILISILVLAGFIMKISHSRIGEQNEYRARFDYVRGMGKGAMVAFGGMEVGSVKKIEIAQDDPQLIEVLFAVDKKVPIHEDCAVSISSIGIMGESYIEITPGSREMPILPTGSLIEISLPTGKMDDLIRISANIVKKIDGLIGDIAEEGMPDELKFALQGIKDTAIGAKDFLTHLDELVTGENKENIEKSVLALRTGIEDGGAHIKDTLISIENMVKRLDGFVEALRGDTQIALANIKRLTFLLEEMGTENKSDIREVARSMRGFVNHLENTLETNQGNISETMVNIRDATYNGKEFADNIKRAPWKLIWPGKVAPREKDKTVR